MISPYDNLPKPLFTPVPLITDVEASKAYCVGFELEAWRCNAYADHMIEWLIDYALKSDEIKTLTHGNTYVRLKQAASRIYQSAKYKTRGEIGEISIHAICRQYFGTIPFAPRVFYLTSSNEVVKSFDMVHVRYLPGENIELWLGESKFFEKRGDAIGKAIASVTAHIDQGFLKNEKLLLGPQVSNDIPHFEKIRELLSEEISLDALFQKAVFPIFIAADSAAVATNKTSSADYYAAVAEELRLLQDKIAASGLTSKIKVVLIYVPIKSKIDLSSAFDKRLKGLCP
ncbi:HamA C-terminal domain-containing protein [Rhizobium sp. LjRoot254]|uniref:HamA C-terminal domain-containing protein n=1 Tax=Rhizobium sp. LjRoot254 TaxID=3342297 RepID=UPI003ECE658B